MGRTIVRKIFTIDKDTMQQIEPTLPVIGLNYLSGSDDGDRVVVSSDEGISVFDGQSGARLGAIKADSFNGTSSVMRLAVAPGGRRVAATVEGDVLVYDLETRNVLHNLSGARGFTDVSVNGDGEGRDGDGPGPFRHPVRRPQWGADRRSSDHPRCGSRFAALRPDGKELAIGGGFGHEFLVWDLDPEHWVTAACELAGRNLNQDEWDTYIGDLAEYHETCPSPG